MSGETKEVDGNKGSEDSKAEEKDGAGEGEQNVDDGPKTIEEAKEALAALKSKSAKDAALIEKLRKYEKENKDKADAAESQLKEQGKYKDLYDAELKKRQDFETRFRNTAVNAAIEKVLKEKNVAAVSTALKLFDRSKVDVSDEGEVDTKSILAQLDALKKTDPILFEGKKAPDVKRPGEGEPQSGYEAEISKAKSHNEILAIMKKYGKG